MNMIDVMKRLAELDSTNPNVVKENQNLPVATSAPRREYDLETTILNPAYSAWENGAGDENNPPDETIEVGINYTLDTDQDYDGRSFPVIDSSEVYDLATGQELNISDKRTLDSVEQAIWKDSKSRQDDQYEDMSNQGNMGAHGEETISPIHGGQRKEETMENLNLESLRYLAGVKETIAECGMGGSGAPASINITAGSGQELTGMLKDIMNLAGVSKVEPHHMPLDNPDAGPSTVISAPPMAGASGHQMDPNAEMHKLMAIVGEPEQDRDSMNSGDQDGEGDEEEMDEDNDRMYDSSPDEKVMGDPMAQFGDINSGDHRERQKGLPVAKPMETTFKQLMADYEQFIAEGVSKGPAEGDVPAYLRKQKRPGQAAAQTATDKRNASSGAKVWSSKRTSEGAVKQAAEDLKDMSEAEFKKKYGKTKAEARKALSTPKKKVSESVSGIPSDVAASMLSIIDNGMGNTNVIDDLVSEFPHYVDQIEELKDEGHRVAHRTAGRYSAWDYITDELEKLAQGGMFEAKKPSAGMTAKEKSAVAKKAVAGKDIGKAGKGFAKVEKAAAKGDAKNPKAVAAAAMWKAQAKK